MKAEDQRDPFGWRSSLSMDLEGFAQLSAAALSSAPLGGSGSAQDLPVHARRYRALSVLGQGGMGRVWFGWDEVLQRHVAIKEPLGSPDSPEAARLMREAMLTARLEHPGAVAIHDVYHEDERPHFVMALVRGETLSSRVASLRAQGKEPRALLRHVLEVCDVIAHAHRRGVIHRDLTPRNVLIDADDSARVIDWGLAVALDEDSHLASGAGTPGFMSPEQREGSPVDARSDVWSIGALLHYLIHGAPPSLATPRPRSIDPELDAIVTCALAHDPGDRYSDARAMGEDLRRWFGGRLVEAYDATPSQLAARFMRLYRGRIAIAALAVAALTASLVWGTVSTSRQAARARDSARLAEEATARAQAESARTRETLSELYVREFDQAVATGHIHLAHDRVARALELHDGPLQRGAQMRAALLARATLVSSLELPPCNRGWFTTLDPDVAVCPDDAHGIRGFVDGALAWSFDTLSTIHLRSDAARLYHLNGGELLDAIDLRTGALIETDARRGAFADRVSPNRLDASRHALLDHADVPTPCERIEDARRHDDGAWWQLCDDGTLWRQRGVFERVPLPPYAPPTHFTFDHEGRAWLVTERGQIFPHDGSSPSISLGGPAAYMERILGTSRILVQGRQNITRVLDAEHGTWLVSFADGTRMARALPDGDITLIRAQGANAPERLERWRLPERPPLWKITRNSGFTSVDWTRDSRTLHAASGDGRLHTISPLAGAAATSLSVGALVTKDVTIDRVSGDVFTSNMDRKGTVRSRHDGSSSITDTFAVEAGPQRRLEALSDGTILGLPYSDHVNVLDPQTRTFVQHPAPEITHDADTDEAADAAVLCGATRLWRWRVGEGIEPTGWEGEASAAALAEDGAIAVGERNTLVLLRADGSERGRVEVDARVLDLDWRPGHDHLVTGHRDGVVIVWDARTLTEIARARPHSGRVSNVQISPDGALLATASWDASISFMDLTVLDEVSASTPTPEAP